MFVKLKENLLRLEKIRNNNKKNFLHKLNKIFRGLIAWQIIINTFKVSKIITMLLLREAHSIANNKLWLTEIFTIILRLKIITINNLRAIIAIDLLIFNRTIQSHIIITIRIKFNTFKDRSLNSLPLILYKKVLYLRRNFISKINQSIQKTNS